MTETPIDLDVLAKERARWNPWWIWLLFALWLISTLTFVLWSLRPRYSWTGTIGRWVWKAGDFFLHKSIAAANAGETLHVEEGAAPKREFQTVQENDVASWRARLEPPTSYHHRRRSTKDIARKGSRVTEHEIELDELDILGMGSSNRNSKGRLRQLSGTGWRKLQE